MALLRISWNGVVWYCFKLGSILVSDSCVCVMVRLGSLGAYVVFSLHVDGNAGLDAVFSEDVDADFIVVAVDDFVIVSEGVVPLSKLMLTPLVSSSLA